MPPSTEATSVEPSPTRRRNAGPVQDAGVDVAPEMVCPEPVGGARASEGGRGVGGDGIVGLQHVGEDRREHDDEHDEAARGAQRLLAAEAQQGLRPARIRRAHGAATTTIPLAAIAHPRVEHAVEHVHGEVRDDHHHGDEHDEGLHDGVVAPQDGLHEEARRCPAG